MKLLIDTNIFIPLEPASSADIEPNSEAAARLFQRAQLGGHTTYLHPAQSHDINRDKDHGRADVRRILVAKYAALPDPPPISAHHATVLGSPAHGTNDWVDNCLVVAVAADAVDFLVSEDKGVRKKAKRLGIEDRVLSLDEAVRFLGGHGIVVAPPAVRSISPHALDRNDPIFDSFRGDYSGFDKWFAKCCRQHRQTWKIDGSSGLAAICIVKHGDSHEGVKVGGSPLKICSFKVSDACNGFKYGELLLKTVFEYAFTHRHTGIWVTVFERHAGLVELLEDFGFVRQPVRTNLGEMILAKSLEPEADVHGLEHHIKYGPPRFDDSRPWHVVPIQPRYSDALFPESCRVRGLFEGQFSFGNAIRKAYLCHAPSRQLRTGDVLAFFRTQRDRGVIAIGIVERTLVSGNALDIMRAVARRTVYSAEEIAAMSGHRDVLTILFRQVRVITPPTDPSVLQQAGVFRREPQAIMRVSAEGTRWLVDQFGA